MLCYLVLLCYLSVTLVDIPSLVVLARVDSPVDNKVLDNAKRAGQRHYRLRKSRGKIEIVKKHIHTCMYKIKRKLVS